MCYITAIQSNSSCNKKEERKKHVLIHNCSLASAILKIFIQNFKKQKKTQLSMKENYCTSFFYCPIIHICKFKTFEFLGIFSCEGSVVFGTVAVGTSP